jgi:hypothetical protein
VHRAEVLGLGCPDDVPTVGHRTDALAADTDLGKNVSWLLTKFATSEMSLGELVSISLHGTRQLHAGAGVVHKGTCPVLQRRTLNSCCRPVSTPGVNWS